MKALIVGYGSIGRRHARVLMPLVDQIAVVTSQLVAGHSCFASLAEAMHSFQPDYVVICTATAAHADSLNLLKKLGFVGQVLVEKPLFMHSSQNAAPYPFSIRVAYQLRFHKVILALKDALAERQVLSAHVYVGQHLSQWRPGRDAKTTYSAIRAQGGGVLRDLSHELDLAAHLMGGIAGWQGIASRLGDVTVDSEDTAAFLLQCRRCPIMTLQMNCLDQVPRREWIITTNDAGIRADVIRGTLSINDKTTNIACDSDDAYQSMHQALMDGRGEQLCSFEEGLALTRLIDTVPIV